MSNLNKAYQKGPFRNVDPEYKVNRFEKRWINKKWRKTGRSIPTNADFLPTKARKQHKLPKTITVKITHELNGCKWSQYNKYSTMRDAQNAINRHTVIRALFL